MRGEQEPDSTAGISLIHAESWLERPALEVQPVKRKELRLVGVEISGKAADPAPLNIDPACSPAHQ